MFVCKTLIECNIRFHNVYAIYYQIKQVKILLKRGHTKMLIFDILDPGSSSNLFISCKFEVLGTILFQSFSNLSF